MMERGATSGRPHRPARLRQFVSDCLERRTLLRSLRTALVVGTVLALINHAQQLLSGQVSATWLIPTLLTYLVPFSVATYGQVVGRRQQVPPPTYSMVNPASPSRIEDMPTQPLAVVFSSQRRSYHRTQGAVHAHRVTSAGGPCSLVADATRAFQSPDADYAPRAEQDTIQPLSYQPTIVPSLTLPFLLSESRPASQKI